MSPPPPHLTPPIPVLYNMTKTSHRRKYCNSRLRCEHYSIVGFILARFTSPFPPPTHFHSLISSTRYSSIFCLFFSTPPPPTPRPTNIPFLRLLGADFRGLYVLLYGVYARTNRSPGAQWAEGAAAATTTKGVESGNDAHRTGSYFISDRVYCRSFCI